MSLQTRLSQSAQGKDFAMPAFGGLTLDYSATCFMAITPWNRIATAHYFSSRSRQRAVLPFGDLP
jgi:glycine cleavage system protein P-like pyridoxal-binding family